jgi:hypothetical protein
MTSRVMRLLAVASLALALPGAAQRAGTVEVGAFARYTNFDNGLGMGNPIAMGGRAAVYLGRAFAVELDVARATGSSITHTPVHFRVVQNASVGARMEAVIGVGYVRNWYGAPYDVTDGGLSALVGLRYQVTPRLWVRFGTDLDMMLHTSNDSPFAFYNGNWGLHLGAGARLNK